MTGPVDMLVAQWARLGVAFNVRPASRADDLESLIVQTARHAGSEPRLFIMAASWLARCSLLVAHHRLRQMAVEQLEGDALACLGLLIETAGRFQPCGHLDGVLRVCRPAKPPHPLFEVDRSLPGLAELAEKKACVLSRKWGLWSEPVDQRSDALRPIEWILDHNPPLRLRAVFQGGLRASVLACLAVDEVCSEADLSRRCGVTRKAVHEAVDHLWFCGLVRRMRKGRAYQIRLCEQNELRRTG